MIGRYPVPSLGGQVVPVMTFPVLGSQGGFAGVVLAGLDAGRLGQALPAATDRTDPQIGVFLQDGTLLARGRNARLTHARLEAEWLPEPVAGGGGERVLPRAVSPPGTVVVTARVPGFDLLLAGEAESAPEPVVTVSRLVRFAALLLGSSLIAALLLAWRRLPRLGPASTPAAATPSAMPRTRSPAEPQQP
ncbi:MAG: hypothetical protein K2X11_20260, partial [Acetobacteraceae bacterium]|nr:hypothetical protein [Acetobacteraceae bacterium]